MLRLGSLGRNASASRDGAHAAAIAVERGADGFSAAWCLDLPGCYTLVRPGEDPALLAAVGVAEYLAWSHERSGGRVHVDDEHVAVIESVSTPARLGCAESLAIFAPERQQPGSHDFPLWSDAHDRAHDELIDLILATPAALLRRPVDESGRTLLDIARDAGGDESALNATLINGPLPPAPTALAGLVPHIRESHRHLQEAICGVPRSFHVQRPLAGQETSEEWTVRKAMRRSIWRLRYHTAEFHRARAQLWLP